MDQLKGGGSCFALPETLWLDELTSAHVAELRERRLAEGNSKATVNWEVNVLRRLVNVARKEWGCRVREVAFPRFKERVKTRWLTGGEERRLLADWQPKAEDGERRRQQQDNLDFVTVLLDTGRRVGEWCAVPWSAVAVDFSTITLVQEKSKTEHSTVVS